MSFFKNLAANIINVKNFLVKKMYAINNTSMPTYIKGTPENYDTYSGYAYTFPLHTDSSGNFITDGVINNGYSYKSSDSKINSTWNALPYSTCGRTNNVDYCGPFTDNTWSYIKNYDGSGLLYSKSANCFVVKTAGDCWSMGNFNGNHSYQFNETISINIDEFKYNNVVTIDLTNKWKRLTPNLTLVLSGTASSSVTLNGIIFSGPQNDAIWGGTVTLINFTGGNFYIGRGLNDSTVSTAENSYFWNNQRRYFQDGLAIVSVPMIKYNGSVTRYTKELMMI